MAKNVEIKARLDSLAAARQIAEQIATCHLGTLRQLDTYFNCPTGRLKLREIDDGTVQLIAYQRPDTHCAAVSNYRLCPLQAAEPIKTAVGSALGVWTTVSKTREVILCNSVRIHLDEVSGLGSFIEFEDVLPEGEAGDDRRVKELMDRFELSERQLIAVSYSDLLSAASPQPK